MLSQSKQEPVCNQTHFKMQTWQCTSLALVYPVLWESSLNMLHFLLVIFLSLACVANYTATYNYIAYVRTASSEANRTMEYHVNYNVLSLFNFSWRNSKQGDYANPVVNGLIGTASKIISAWLALSDTLVRLWPWEKGLTRASRKHWKRVCLVKAVQWLTTACSHEANLQFHLCSKKRKFLLNHRKDKKASERQMQH